MKQSLKRGTSLVLASGALCAVISACRPSQQPQAQSAQNQSSPTGTLEEENSLALATIESSQGGLSGVPSSEESKAFQIAAADQNKQNQQQQITPDSYVVVDEFKEPKFTINKGDIFKDSQVPNSTIEYDEVALLNVLNQTKYYFQAYYQTDPNLPEAGALAMHDISPIDVFNTLDFMIAVLQEDIQTGQPTRLKDPAFINQNFRTLEWRPYNPQDAYQETLRITKYAIFSSQGSAVKTETFNTPLYKLRDEFEQTLFYKNYSKQDVLSGIYEEGGQEFGKAVPLTYLTRAGLEEALLQGTLSVTFPDGSSTYFNVDKNNGVAYVKGLAAGQQRRYWYFNQTNAIKGYGQDFDAKIPIEPGVTFAGDIANIGLGKIVAIEHSTSGVPEINLGVIADTGGAFAPNLFQLDLLAGIYPDRQAFSANTGHLPSYAKAYILIKK